MGEELTRRFGLPRWQFALTATDANRFAIRLARHVTGRPKVLVFNWCYHGTVDETFATLDATGAVVEREGNLGPPVPLDRDDARRRVERRRGARARARARRRRVRARRAGADEHRHRAARARLPRRAARADPQARDAADHRRDAHALRRARRLHRARTASSPDVLTVGKAIGGGIPAAAYGFTEEVADAHRRRDRRTTTSDVGGVGGTLAGERPLARGDARDADAGADRRGVRADDRARRALRARASRRRSSATACRGTSTRLGCRVEYLLPPRPPAQRQRGARRQRPSSSTGFIHLYALNRGILLTPFHNMALMSPATTEADVDRHTEVFAEAAAELTGR